MSRIFQTNVPPLLPSRGPILFLIFGEAPGPRGADQSGIPFWGDRAGICLYRVLEEAGLAQVPVSAWGDWDGARLKTQNLFPTLKDVGLSNAYPRCPTLDGQHFKAPTDRELTSPENIERLHRELHEASDRCPRLLRVITLGKRAQWILNKIPKAPPFELCGLPHPSAQGLLQAAPNKGKGLRLMDLQSQWEKDLEALLTR